MKVLDIPISEINNYIEDGFIYFWGAGKALEPYVNTLIHYVSLGKIKAIVDSKIKGKRNYRSNSFSIISPEEFLNEINEKDLLIITTDYYEEIIDKLRKEVTADKISACVYKYTIKTEKDKIRDRIMLPKSIRNEANQMIPKIIHYCWFGNNPIPDRHKKCIDSWNYYCPDYEIKCWDESNYDVNKIEYMKQAYSLKKWAFVSDYARLDIIYNYGGIYLDTDVELLKNIDDLLYNKSFCGFETSDYVAFGLGFGSVKHNEIIRDIMKIYEESNFENSDGTLNETTCPIIQTKILEKRGLLRNGQYQIVDGMVVMPEWALCPLSVWTRKNTARISEAFMYHHFAASWDKNADSGVRKLTHFYQDIVDS